MEEKELDSIYHKNGPGPYRESKGKERESSNDGISGTTNEPPRQSKGKERELNSEATSSITNDHTPGPRWTRTPVTIHVPCTKKMKDPGSKPYTGSGFMHRNLMDVIREKVSDPDRFARFHIEPYELLHQPNDNDTPSRVHGELYTSDAFLEEHQKVQEGPGLPGLERVVVALMFASDATQLTKFTDAQLWPLYLSFGNDSKELRTKPSAHLMEPVAFFEHVRTLILADNFTG